MASLIANLMGVLVGIIIAFSAVIPVVQTTIWGTNLTGAAKTIADIFVLFIVIGMLLVIVNSTGLGG